MKNKNLIIAVCLVFLILIINFVAAIGISKDYFEGNPIKIGPGETKEFVFGQIIVTDKEGDRNISLDFVEGNEVAKIISDETFNVKAGSRDNFIKIKVSIPQDIAEGTKYTVTIRVNDKTPPAAGMVGFTTSTTSSIPVLVEKTPEPTTPAPEKPAADYSWYIIVLVIIIIIAIVAYFLLRNKGTGNNKSK